VKNSCWGIAVLVFASLAAGCADWPSTPTSPSSVAGSSAITGEQLAGTWNLQSMQRAGQTEQARPSGARYTVTFGDGRLSTLADCNVCGGAFSLSGQTLTAGPALACTRAACPSMEFESAYTNILSGDSTVTLDDRSLVLTSTRGTLRFTR
jgi:heat shock protein HslJ